MLIEAVRGPVRCRWVGGEVTLEPGQPVDLPEDRARKLLERAPGKVRKAKPDWLAEWRTLAAVTNGIVKEDPRFPLVMATLASCDEAFLANDWLAFQQAAICVKAEVKRRG